MKFMNTLFIVMMMAISLNGQTNWIGIADTDWNNTANWTGGVPSAGQTATVLTSPNNPVITTNLTIDFTLQNFATITIQNVEVENAATIVNFGNGIIINNGNFKNNQGQFVNNNGIITNNSQFSNDGTIQSNGLGILENTTNAVLDNNSGAGINNFASINNAGIFNNAGSIANSNVIDNSGTFNNNGPLNQGVNGVFNNLPSGLFNNNNSVNNSGEINNTSGALIINESLLQNNSNGTINNAGQIDNNAEINNAGLFENTGTLISNDQFTNNFGANLLNNQGNITNNSCATFNQFSANAVSCVSNCAFINNGIIYQIPGAGLIDITGGTGIVLNNINQQPTPTANCQDVMVVLDENGSAMIEPLDIDENSMAGYCSIADRQVNINTFTCADIGQNIVTLTVTDALGAANFCTATVTVIDGMPPVISNCPQDIILTLDAGECSAIVNFDNPVAEDICGATLIRTDNSGLNSGDVFPIGETVISYLAEDGTNQSVCSFSITINEFPNPISALFCNSQVEVALDNNCEALIGADDILEGGPYACYDNYIVDIFFDEAMTQPVPTSPLLTSAQLDDILYVMVTEPIVNNSCWGRIVAKDYLAPEITCEDKTITCLENTDPLSIGFPASFDNCDNGLFPTFEDEFSGGGCEDGIITRTWTVTDASGNSNNCQQTITITRPDFNLLTFPADLDGIDAPALICSDNPDTNPDNTGWPTIDGQSVENTCNFSAIYEDQLLPVCEGTDKIVRTWTAYDWCNSAVLTHIQIIKIIDEQGPELSCPAPLEISTGQNSCLASLILPEPTVFDACSNTFNTTVNSTAGQVQNGVISNLPIGIHTIVYEVSDDCENTSTCSFNITVTDAVPPVAICESAHTIGLTIDEPTLVPALTFDDGSYDNCSNLLYEVRRMDAAQCPGFDGTTFSDYVPFYCCDVTDIVMVELRITDASGNTNSCMVEVIVEDKLNPAIQCPPNLTLDCQDDYTDPVLTGEAIASDNCSYTLSFFDDVNINNCGDGNVNRIWTATDPGGRTASCLQQITLSNSTPFYIADTDCDNADPNDGVIWPCDYITTDCAAGTEPAITGMPQIFEDVCDLVALTYEDIELPITEPACRKIIRVWTVQDWCQYDASSGAGEWQYNQIIKVLNNQPPTITSDCEDRFFCGYEADCGDVPVTLIAEASDDCTNSEDLVYNYKIDLGNDGQFNISGTGADASSSFPLGTHRIRWWAEDGCGNISSCEYLFTIEDCKRPTAYCINGLAIDLMPVVNEIEISATDFDLGSFDNCELEEFRINAPSLGPGQNVPPTSAGPSLTFNCNDVGTQTIDLWVKDIFGNWDYCSTYVLIQDNSLGCTNQPSAQISGQIKKENGAEVASVLVHLENSIPGIPAFEITGANGAYGFPDLVTGYNYTVRPEKNEDPLNGVSTFDLVLMNKHILGTGQLDSPYKMIAADINASGSISTFDLVLLRRLILQIDDDFTMNNSWRFIEAGFQFPDPSDPFATVFPEVLEINSLNEDMAKDFIAVKIGDVNGNAATGNFAGQGDPRNMQNPLVFTVQDELLNPGRMYQLDFRAGDIKDIYGYQFTFDFNRELLRFVNIVPGALPGLTLNNFGLSKLNEGRLTSSWNQEAILEEFDAETVLFSLVFEAKEAIHWSDAVAISSSYTRAEAYTRNFEILGLQLKFTEATESRNRFKLYPNQPNPFAEETLISFNLPEETALNFSIQDVSAKIIYNTDFLASEGYNELLINKGMLNGPGVYFYTIKTKTHRVSQKMILIRE